MGRVVFVRRSLLGALVVAGLASSGVAVAQNAAIEIVVKEKKFDPAEVKAPANTRIVINIKNRDSKAIEFESKSLKAEKVIAANAEGVVRVGTLKAGRYEFFDDFNQINRGTLLVE